MLLLLKPGEHPPRNKDAFLMTAAQTLRLLVAEATPEEIEQANNRLRDLLPEEFQIGLPCSLLEDRRTPDLLYLNPFVEGTNFVDWKNEIPDALTLPSMPQDEADSEWAMHSLESYLSPLLS